MHGTKRPLIQDQPTTQSYIGPTSVLNDIKSKYSNRIENKLEVPFRRRRIAWVNNNGELLSET
jgi:hypothetical protein